MRTAMYKRRRTLLPALPQTREEIRIPDDLQTINGRDFLIINTPGQNKIIAFATDKNLQILTEAATLYVERCNVLRISTTVHSNLHAPCDV